MKKIYVYQIANPRKVGYTFRDYNKDSFRAEDYFYAGEIEVADSNIYDMLESAFSKGQTDGFNRESSQARSVSISDVLEIDNAKYYVDTIGFVKLN